MDDSFAIDKLAKVIVDTIPKPKDVGDTLYGTIVSYSDNLYVRVDGSDQLTPVKSTASYSDGERVAVLIKDHKAVVTGNFSHPSATEASVESNVAAINNNITELGNVVATKVSTSDFEATNTTVKNLVADDATIKNTLKAHEGKFDSIKTETAEIEGRITAAEGDIDQLQATQIKAETLDAKYATIENLNATNTDVHTLQTDYADVTTKLTAAEADISDLSAKKLSVDAAKATYATIDQLQTGYAHISNGIIDNATIDQAKVNNLAAHYATADLANVSNAWVEKGVVKDGAISNAMIGELNASKITSGTLDAAKVNVSHINASSITTGKLTVGGVTLDVANKSATVNGSALAKGSVSMDRLDSSVKDAIDGAIETWTVAAVPTLSNDPASKWTDSTTRDKHVGDIAYVVNSGKAADGYAYRFAKSSDGAYSWVLIKDSDVTAALSRLATAEGNISGLKSFESSSEQWQEKTDSSISTLSSSTTSLATRMSTAEGTLKNKVDTTTFSALSDTVDGHTQKITKATSDIQTLTSKQGTLESTVSTQTTKINELEETADGSKQRISALETTTTDQGTRIATAESNISKNAKAIETKVSSSTYSTDKAGLESKIKSNETAITQTSSSLGARITSTEASVKKYADGKVAQEVTDRNAAITAASNGIKAQMSETYTTKTEFNALGIGGRNLLLESSVPNRCQSPTKYPCGQYNLAEHVVSGEKYVISIKATFEKAYWIGFYFGGVICAADTRITSDGTQVISLAFTANDNYADKDLVCIFVRDKQDKPTSGESSCTIEWVKLEKGTRPTDWTPAPEDLASGKALSDLNTTLTTQYTKTADFTVAPSQLAAKFTSTESSVKAYADDKVTAEATARNAAISASAESVKSYVAQTYTTKDATSGISSKLEQTATSLTSEISARTETDKTVSDLSSRLTQTAESLKTEISSRESADNSISEKQTQLEQTVSGISTRVENIDNNYVNTTAYATDREQTDETIKDTVRLATTDADGKTIFEKINSVSNTVDGMTNTITTISGETDGNSQALKELSTTVAVTQENGQPVLTFGSSESTMKTRITNTEMQFLSDGKVLASASGDSFRSPKTDVDEVKMGRYTIRERSTGGIEFVYG